MSRNLVELRGEVDFDRYAGIYNDPRTTRYMEFRFKTVPMTPQYLIDTYSTAGMILKGVYLDGKMVGIIRLQGLLGEHGVADKHTMIDPNYWKMGIGTAATKLLLKMHPYRIVTSSCYSTNEGAQGMNLKCGFQLESSIHDYYRGEYGYVDKQTWVRRAS